MGRLDALLTQANSKSIAKISEFSVSLTKSVRKYGFPKSATVNQQEWSITIGRNGIGRSRRHLLLLLGSLVPSLRQFTPVLADFYTDLKDSGAKIEIIFVSSDRSEGDMRSYMNEAHGDWLALPWGSPITSVLKHKYNVGGIPCLVAVKKDGTVITADGRSDVMRKGTACYRDWSK